MIELTEPQVALLVGAFGLAVVWLSILVINWVLDWVSAARRRRSLKQAIRRGYF